MRQNKGYVVGQWIVYFVIFLNITFMAVVVTYDGWDALLGYKVVSCPAGSVQMCSNPYYLNCDDAPSFCEKPFLERGFSRTIGVKSELASVYAWFAVLVWLPALLLNHLLYNRGYKVWRNIKASSKKFFDKFDL